MRNLLWLFFSLFILINTTDAQAQTDTIFFNRDWIECARDEAAFYRTRPLKEGEGYRVNDYYISGGLQMTAFSLTENDNVFDGIVEYYSESGALIRSSTFKNGIKEGVENYFAEDGTLLSSGTYKNYSMYNGDFYDHSDSYIQKLTFEKGSLTHMEITDLNKKTLAKIEYQQVKDKSGILYEVHYYDQNGDYIGHCSVDTTKTVYEGITVEYMFEPMRKLEVSHMVNGVADKIRAFYPNGRVKFVKIKTGEASAEQVFFDKTGKVIDTLLIQNDEPYQGGMLEYYHGEGQNDISIRYQQYEDGTLHGSYTLFYPNGKPLEKGTYVNGIKHGIVHFFTEQGDPYLEGRYNYGKKMEGDFLSVPPDRCIESYQDGDLITKKRYYTTGELRQIEHPKVQTIYFTKEGKEEAVLEYRDRRPFNGVLRSHTGNDNIAWEELYKNGERIRYKQFSNGAVTSQDNYLNGVKTETINYYPTGEKMMLTQYGKEKTNTTMYFDRDGTIIGNLKTVRWEKNGEELTFKDGCLQKKSIYIDNELAHETVYTQQGSLLYDIDYNGMASFYNKWGRLIGQGEYKDNDPYSGSFYTYNDAHIKKIKNLKDGTYDGRVAEYEWHYRTKSNTLVSEGYYSNGAKNGRFNEYQHGLLLLSINFTDGLKQGEAIFCDDKGNELSRAVYKDNMPFSGTFYTYFYNIPSVKSRKTYSNGMPHGEHIEYGPGGEPKEIVTFDNGNKLCEKTYVNGKEFVLYYHSNIPANGLKPDGREVVHYKDGKPVKKDYYRSMNYQALSSEIVYNDGYNNYVETSYYIDGKLKSSTAFSYSQKDGDAVYYNQNGEIIARGQYREGKPISGTFMFLHSYDNSEDYVLVEITNSTVEVLDFIKNEKSQTFRLNADKVYQPEEWEKKVANFLKMIATLNNYDIDY